MIYKTKTKYFRLETRLDEVSLIEMRGNKIVVNDYNFYVDKDFNITEEITGLQVPYSEEMKKKIWTSFVTLEDIEEYIISIFKIIEEAIILRSKEGYTIQNIQNRR